MDPYVNIQCLIWWAVHTNNGNKNIVPQRFTNSHEISRKEMNEKNDKTEYFLLLRLEKKLKSCCHMAISMPLYKDFYLNRHTKKDGAILFWWKSQLLLDYCFERENIVKEMDLSFLNKNHTNI